MIDIWHPDLEWSDIHHPTPPPPPTTNLPTGKFQNLNVRFK